MCPLRRVHKHIKNVRIRGMMRCIWRSKSTIIVDTGSILDGARWRRCNSVAVLAGKPLVFSDLCVDHALKRFGLHTVDCDIHEAWPACLRRHGDRRRPVQYSSFGRQENRVAQRQHVYLAPALSDNNDDGCGLLPNKA